MKFVFEQQTKMRYENASVVGLVKETKPPTSCSCFSELSLNLCHLLTAGLDYTNDLFLSSGAITGLQSSKHGDGRPQRGAQNVALAQNPYP